MKSVVVTYLHRHCVQKESTLCSNHKSATFSHDQIWIFDTSPLVINRTSRKEKKKYKIFEQYYKWLQSI